MSAGRAQFGHFVGLGAHDVAEVLTAVVRGAGKALRRSPRALPARVRARGCPGRGPWSAAGRGSEGGGEAEAAQEGVEVFLGTAVEGDRGPRAGESLSNLLCELGQSLSFCYVGG